MGFSYITERAKSVNSLLRTDVDIFTIHSQEEIAPLLKELTTKGYVLIIGDVATCRQAKEMDINNLLLTSGEESIMDALDDCLVWTGAYATSMEQLNLLRQVVNFYPGHVVVLNSEGTVLYQTVNLPYYSLTASQLDELSGDMPASDTRELILQQESQTLYICVRQLTLEGLAGCRAFYLRKIPASYQHQNGGITVRNFRTEPANKDFFRQNSTQDADIIDVARSFCGSNRPVLLTGDVGVGKAEMAEAIHRYSESWQRPFIHIDCAVAKTEDILSWLEARLPG